jgi:hypothetical protein
MRRPFDSPRRPLAPHLRRRVEGRFALDVNRARDALRAVRRQERAEVRELRVAVLGHQSGNERPSRLQGTHTSVSVFEIRSERVMAPGRGISQIILAQVTSVTAALSFAASSNSSATYRHTSPRRTCGGIESIISRTSPKVAIVRPSLSSMGVDSGRDQGMRQRSRSFTVAG